MLIIIIPYRDRLDHLNKIIPHFNKLFEEIKYSNYHIFVIEQIKDNRKFNRGALLNAGVKLATKKFDQITKIIFHDVDILPNLIMIQNYINQNNKIEQYATPDTYKKYSYDNFFGAANGFPLDSFKKINGYPNSFWGWGGEDDAVQRRIKINKLNINFIKTGSYYEIDHDHDKSNNIIKTTKKTLLRDQHNFKTDGFLQIRFYTTNTKQIFKNTTLSIIHIINNNLNLEHYNFKTPDTCKETTYGFKELFKPLINSNYLIDIYIRNVCNAYPIDHNYDREQTFDYILNVVHKGIYIKIKDNKILLFNLIVNPEFKNSWSKTFSSNDLLSNNCLIEEIKDKKEINMWYSVFPQFFYLLKQTLSSHTVKDCEFIYNKKDFPILKKNLDHPYDHLFNKNSIKNFKDKYTKPLLPFLSSCSSPKFQDQVVPTPDDIDIVYQLYFPIDCKNNYDLKLNSNRDNIKWNQKINRAVFRGKATGCGVLIDNNQRLKLCSIAAKNNNKIDAGITGWNKRKKAYNGKIYQIEPHKFNFRKADKLTRNEMFKYKYLINVDGHVRAYRLSYELMSNSIVLLVESSNDYYLFYEHLLKPYVHYIPVKKDLSNIIEQIKYCDNNQDKCIEIVKNANNLMKKVLTNDYLTSYLSNILNNI